MIKEDFKKILNDKKNKIETITNNKLKFTKEKDILISLADYLSVINRISTPLNSNIIFSKELHDTLETPLISNKDIKILKEIIYKMKKGSLLLSYLSKSILKNKDTLYNHWGIQHLHLSNDLENKYNRPISYENRVIMKKRSKLILLYYINSKNVYLINIIKHPSGYKWVSDEYFEIIKNNWPFLLEPYKINNTKNTSTHFNNKTNYKLVKRTITLTKTKNNIYFPLGRGSSTAGTPIKYLEKAKKIMFIIEDYNKQYNDKKYTLKINNHNRLYIKNNDTNEIINLNLDLY